MSPVATPITAPVVVGQHFGGGKSRIDLHTQRLGTVAQPLGHVGQRHDVVAVIVHQRRHHEIRQPDRAGRTEHQEVICLHRRLERMVRIVAPIGNELVDADRVDHCARENVRTDFTALLQDNHRQFGIELLEPYGG
jgi:hypothetical protein